MRPWAFAGAAVALLLSLGGPLGRAAEADFAAHMAQHMLLIGAAAPLFALAFVPPFRVRAGAAFAAHAAAIWSAHVPIVVDWMLAYHWVHALEHVVLGGSGVLFWWALRRRPGEGAIWTLATMLHTGFLGALLTFAPRPLYPEVSLAEQQLAGLIMWVPGGMLYLAAGLVFAYRWLSHATDGRHPVSS